MLIVVKRSLIHECIIHSMHFSDSALPLLKLQSKGEFPWQHTHYYFIVYPLLYFLALYTFFQNQVDNLLKIKHFLLSTACIAAEVLVDRLIFYLYV